MVTIHWQSMLHGHHYGTVEQMAAAKHEDGAVRDDDAMTAKVITETCECT